MNTAAGTRTLLWTCSEKLTVEELFLVEFWHKQTTGRQGAACSHGHGHAMGTCAWTDTRLGLQRTSPYGDDVRGRAPSSKPLSEKQLRIVAGLSNT